MHARPNALLEAPGDGALAQEIARATREPVYARTVFFILPIGFIEPTPACRISYEDGLAFEAVHEDVYRAHGFEIVDVPAASTAERVAVIESWIANH